MRRAFVLINVQSGSEEKVLEKLHGLAGVDEAYYSYGVYDIIAKVRADSMEGLKEMVTRNIRGVSNVVSTLTLIIMEA